MRRSPVTFSVRLCRIFWIKIRFFSRSIRLQKWYKGRFRNGVKDKYNNEVTFYRSEGGTHLATHPSAIPAYSEEYS